MSKHIRYSTPFESCVQSRERCHKVYTKTYVTKWLLLSIACAILLTAVALWGWWEDTTGGTGNTLHPAAQAAPESMRVHQGVED